MGKKAKINKLKESFNEMEYPISDPPLYSDSNYKDKGGKIFYVKPEEFLRLVPKLEMDESSEENIEELMDMMSSGHEIDPPVLYIENGVVANHDGRHRAYAAINLGMSKIPVLVLDNDLNPIGNFNFKPQMKKTIREIIKEEIEEAMSNNMGVKTPVIRRKLYNFYDADVDSAEAMSEDDECLDVIEEAVKGFRVKRYDQNTGNITIIFPNGESEYEYGGMSPFLYKELKRFIKLKNNRAIQSLISNLEKLHENTMIRNYAGGLSLNDKHNHIPPGPVRASKDIPAGTASPIEDEIEESEEKED